MNGGSFEALRARLESPSEATRRLAAHDLVELSRREAAAAPAVVRALIERLPRERDPKAAIRIIRHLVESAAAEAGPVLLAVYDDPESPADIAVEAIRAHGALAANMR